MPRVFVISDIHGNYGPLMEVFRQSGFNYKKDLLISLGDLVDRGPEPVMVVEELMKVGNLINLKGNHDQWFFDYLTSGTESPLWLLQGGRATLRDYAHHAGAARKHFEFFSSASTHYIDEKNRLFLHAGFDPAVSFHLQKEDLKVLLWDRSLLAHAAEYHRSGKSLPGFREIFIGHSPTQLVSSDKPVNLSNLWLMDTGAGHGRFLTIMDVNTKEFWQQKCDFTPLRNEL
jgi:serine/threonine protein phosphatase 1